MKQIKTLYVTDLDGTLLNDRSVISEHSAALLNELSDKGALITFATARTPATVVEIFQGIRLNIPGIVMTGAALYDLSTGRYSDMKFLKKETALQAIEILTESHINEFIYCWRPDNILHAYHPSEIRNYEQSFYELRRDKSLKKFHLSENPNDQDLSHTLLIFSMGLRKSLESIAERLTKALGYPVSYYNDIFSPDYGFMEIFGKDVSKAAAILLLKERYNINRVVAVGDNLNDIPMFGVSDVSVAMGNSFEEVKRKADIVIGTNKTDSVVEFIYNDYLNNR